MSAEDSSKGIGEVPMGVPSNYVNLVTRSGPKMAAKLLSEKVRANVQLTHADASAASALWAQKIANQYPDFIDSPRMSVVAREHLIGLVRDLST